MIRLSHVPGGTDFLHYRNQATTARSKAGRANKGGDSVVSRQPGFHSGEGVANWKQRREMVTTKRDNNRGVAIVLPLTTSTSPLNRVWGNVGDVTQKKPGSSGTT